jgi:hypothetical protein
MILMVIVCGAWIGWLVWFCDSVWFDVIVIGPLRGEWCFIFYFLHLYQWVLQCSIFFQCFLNVFSMVFFSMGFFQWFFSMFFFQCCFFSMLFFSMGFSILFFSICFFFFAMWFFQFFFFNSFVQCLLPILLFYVICAVGEKELCIYWSVVWFVMRGAVLGWRVKKKEEERKKFFKPFQLLKRRSYQMSTCFRALTNYQPPSTCCSFLSFLLVYFNNEKQKLSCDLRSLRYLCSDEVKRFREDLFS